MRSRRGFALILALFILGVFSAILGGAMLRTVYQVRSARAQAAEATAEAGSASAVHAVASLLSGPLRTQLAQTIAASASPSGSWYLSGLSMR